MSYSTLNLAFTDLSKPMIGALHRHGFFPFHVGWSIQPVLALIAGILILIRPKFLNFIVAIYLIVIGLIGIFHWV